MSWSRAVADESVRSGQGIKQFVERDARVGIIELDQQLPGDDAIGVPHGDRHHRAGP